MGGGRNAWSTLSSLCSSAFDAYRKPVAVADSVATSHPAPASELLLFLLPLVNVKVIKHALRSHLPRLPLLGGAAAGGLAGGSGAAAVGGPAIRQPCGICNTVEVLQPWAAVPCGHRFCYYCLRSHCLADPQYSCPLCLSRVEAMQRAVEPALAAGSGSGGENDAG